MGSTKELQMLLAKRDVQIFKLEIENMELKSKLDKFQSIFPSSPPAGGGGLETTKKGGLANTGRKIDRAHGISAKPQSLKNLQESTITKFPELKKEGKIVCETEKQQFLKCKRKNLTAPVKTYIL